MTTISILYHSQYGNTKLAAETIAEGIRDSAAATDITIGDVAGADPAAAADALIIGAPNHMGRPTRPVRKFIDALAKAPVRARAVAVFDTYLGGDFQKAAKDMERRLTEKAPDMKRLAPGLSVRVEGMRGPITDEELRKCREFGRTIANQLQS